jgi:hypothetical protein
MSSFKCEECGKEILDSPTGYTTGCPHHPLKPDIVEDTAIKYADLAQVLRAEMKRRIEASINELTDSDDPKSIYIITDKYGEASEGFTFDLLKSLGLDKE